MALAILELLGFEKANVRFNVDTGTNSYYKLKFGRSVQRRNGIDWVDDVYYSTPMETNQAGGGLLNSSKDISIPARRFENGNAYVQLFSFKTREGKSPAFSRPVHLPMGLGGAGGVPINYSPPFSISAFTNMNASDSFQPPRTIPCRSCEDTYARQASLDDLLAGIIKAAAPVVLNLLGGAQNGTPRASGSVPGALNGSSDQDNVLTMLLNTLLGSITGMVGSGASRQQSLIGSPVQHNRFLVPQKTSFSRPFIFGIDDALIGALAGPILQVLPQLMNAANQRRVQMKQADNKLITDILSDVNRRMLLQQVLQAQRQAPAGGQAGNGADLNQLIQLLQQVPASAQPATGGTDVQLAPVPAATQLSAGGTPVAQSLSLDGRESYALSSRAVISFVTADPVAWNGMQKVLFAKNQGLQFKIRLDVAEPVPSTPLPKAILKIVFKDGSDQSIRCEKTFKQKDVRPKSVMSLPFTQEELAKLPVNTVITVFAEMRWLNSKSGKESKALGSMEVVLVKKYFLKEQGKDVSAEQELTDMKRFRPFWNKVWEAAPIDAASGGRESEKKYLWELDVNAKYSVVLTADHEANGVMETKLLKGKADEESLTQRTEGRMKAGIELSLAELNKLTPLWGGETALDRDRLEALSTDAVAKNNAGEFVYNFRLKGKAGQRGMIWVVPIFKLFEFTLSAIGRVDEAGQVANVTDEKVRFPLPVSARVIGLKSQQ